MSETQSLSRGHDCIGNVAQMLGNPPRHEHISVASGTAMLIGRSLSMADHERLGLL